MRVKKYIASDMQEATKKIRTELGNDAIILSSKIVYTGGVLGLFKKKKIEVIAAVDSEIDMPPPKPKSTNSIKPKSEAIKSIQTKEVITVPSSPELMKEMSELKDMVYRLSVHQNEPLLPDALQQINLRFKEIDVSDGLRGEIVEKLLNTWQDNGGNLTAFDTKRCLTELLNNLEFGGSKFQKKLINVVGPTGVGKTTTLAKLAAECYFKYKKSIAFITTDTYRIAAIEQLKTYAKILNAPIEVSYNAEDFIAAKTKLSQYDIIFIDTAGRNFRNGQYVKELRQMINFEEDMETFLVLSATSRLKDMLELNKQFTILPIEKVIFTKMDEAVEKGHLLDLVLQSKKGVAYFTNGQDVPDDIYTASKEEFIEELLGNLQ